MGIQTRSKTHPTVRVQYDPKSLKRKAEVPLVEKSKRRKTKRVVRYMDDFVDYPTGVGKPFQRSRIEKPIPMPPAGDISGGTNFTPSTIFGEQLKEGLSVIGYASRRIEQLELVKASHMEHAPHIVPKIEALIKIAKADLKALLADKKNLEANSSIINLNKRQEKVDMRIKLLEDCLKTSEFLPEEENIKAAIDGYRSGNIPYSDKYTLIWAGKIVDRAKTYGDFMEDRQERLDRYARDHGPHWLWYESPLNEHPNNAPRASRNTVMPRNVSGNGLGQYYSTLVFWKRDGWVMRLAQNANQAPTPHEVSQFFLETGDGQIYCQDPGPKLGFLSLLDSGATFPSLYQDDFQSLGINPRYYAAQTVTYLSTANGLTMSRLYEMSVTVSNVHGESLVDENDAVWPYHGKYLGGLCPVAVCGNSEPQPDENGFKRNDRLSGILPFLACYVSSSPTRNRMYMGEDRNDVIGSQRMPAHRRWDISMSSYQVHDVLAYSAYGDPHTSFSHANGRIVEVDRQNVPHASFTIVNGGSDQEFTIEHNPKAQCDEARAKNEVDQALRNPPSFHSVGVHTGDLQS